MVLELEKRLFVKDKRITVDYSCAILNEQLAEILLAYPYNTFPLEPSYTKQILKTLFKRLEEQDLEPSENLLNLYIQTLQSTEEYCYRIYPVNDKHIILKESTNAICYGTTGLSLWEASLTLVDYLEHEDLNNAHVLELGSGIGFVSLYISQRFQNTRVTATDCDLNVLNNLKENVKTSK
jgi:hypothetical protein